LLEQRSIQVEHIDKPVPRPGDIVMFLRVLIANVTYNFPLMSWMPKGAVARRQIRVRKRTHNAKFASYFSTTPARKFRHENELVGRTVRRPRDTLVHALDPELSIISTELLGSTAGFQPDTVHLPWTR